MILDLDTNRKFDRRDINRFVIKGTSKSEKCHAYQFPRVQNTILCFISMISTYHVDLNVADFLRLQNLFENSLI